MKAAGRSVNQLVAATTEPTVLERYPLILLLSWYEDEKTYPTIHHVAEEIDVSSRRLIAKFRADPDLRKPFLAIRAARQLSEQRYYARNYKLRKRHGLAEHDRAVRKITYIEDQAADPVLIFDQNTPEIRKRKSDKLRGVPRPRDVVEKYAAKLRGRKGAFRRTPTAAKGVPKSAEHRKAISNALSDLPKTIEHARKLRIIRSKLPDVTVQAIRAARATHTGVARKLTEQLMRKYGISERAVYRIWTGATYGHVPDKLGAKTR